MYKRILFFGLPNKAQIEALRLDQFDDMVWGHVTPAPNVRTVLKAAQAAGFIGKFLVINEEEFVNWGLMVPGVVVGGPR
jgi:hypothetical protein